MFLLICILMRLEGNKSLSISEKDSDLGPWLIPRNRSSKSQGHGRGGAHSGVRDGGSGGR